MLKNSIKEAGRSADLKICKSAPLSLNNHNFSNTEPTYTKYSFMESLLNNLVLEIKLIAYFHGLCSKITFALNISTFTKNYLLSSLDGQSALGMRHFSFKVQNLPIFKVLNLSKENINHLALWYLSCTIPRPKFEKD